MQCVVTAFVADRILLLTPPYLLKRLRIDIINRRLIWPQLYLLYLQVILQIIFNQLRILKIGIHFNVSNLIWCQRLNLVLVDSQ